MNSLKVTPFGHKFGDMGNSVEESGVDWITKSGAAKTWFSASNLCGDLREFAGRVIPNSDAAFRNSAPAQCPFIGLRYSRLRGASRGSPLCHRPFSFLREIRQALLRLLSRAAAHARMPVLFPHLRVCSRHTHPLPCEAILQSSCSRPPTALQCSSHVEGAHK
jgi:hypothetical protein